ncbi:hypothetical protein JX265_006349 [Neoarthrinium moseri]|uniref:DUF7605 domain-containing protein n=1 Tax=Neoarthrinium moseri TaxID=1658444 RepID=A0A9P9WMG2_9PEZI|nr:hypothetical protein JX265_006349 [Neoarthrinium moseri]
MSSSSSRAQDPQDSVDASNQTHTTPPRAILTPKPNLHLTSPRRNPESPGDPDTIPKFTFSAGNEPSFGARVTPPAPQFAGFGGAGRDQGDHVFTFRSLYNATPSPSPQPSPQATPTRMPRLSRTEFDFTRLSIKETSPRPSNSLQLQVAATGQLSSFQAVTDQKSQPTPYSVLDEEPPAHPLFTSVFQSALKDGIAVSKDAMTIIKHTNRFSDDSDLSRLLHDAEDLSNFACSGTKTIAVLGDSGQGKSSLINSLLDFPDIAKTGDIGSACTSVVTEYKQKRKEHVAPITIEVEYLSEIEIEEMVKELLWSYRQLFLPGVDSDITSDADHARYTRESEQAWCALEAAFGHQPGFQKSMLQDMSEGALGMIEERLIGWTRTLNWPTTDRKGFWTSTALTADECWEKTNIFMQDRYWPFTKIIRIYLSASVLKTGLVLADLPDQSLKSSLYAVLTRHIPLAWEESGGKGLNIAVVCTKSEEINLKAARTEFCGPNKVISNAIMDSLDKNLEEAKETSDYHRKKDIKRKQQILLMDARNKHVKEGLQKAYASKVPGGKLDVFCVSNVMYEKYSRKGNTELVRASCIPEVRRLCYSITSDAQFAEGNHFLRSEVSNLLTSLDLWAKSASTSKQERDDGLDDVRYPSASQVRIKFDECFREQVLEFLEKRHLDWEKAAIVEGNRWKQWHWSKSAPLDGRPSYADNDSDIAQYYAFCLNNGHHVTSMREREDWNAKILWKMRMELEYQWDLVEDELPQLFTSVMDTVRIELVYLKDQIQNSSSTKICSILLEGVDARMRSIEYSIELVKETLTTEIRLIRNNASESNYNSYILKEMIPVYRSASSQCGIGRDGRQKEVVHGRLEDGTIFPNISVIIADKIKCAIKRTKKDLTTVLKQQMTLIRNDIDLAITAQQNDGSRLSRQGPALEIERLKERHFALLESLSSLT